MLNTNDETDRTELKKGKSSRSKINPQAVLLHMGSESARPIWMRSARNMPTINPGGPATAALSNDCSRPDPLRITGARKPAADTARTGSARTKCPRTS